MAARPLYPMKDSRRGFIRVTPKSGFIVYVFGKPFQGADLNVYGLSFMIDCGSPEEQVCREGLHLQSLRFQLNDRWIDVQAKIKNLVPGDGFLRVGVEFENISVEDVWFLSEYIVREGVPAPVQLQVKAHALRKRGARGKARAKPRAKPRPKAKLKRRKSRSR